MSEFKVGDCVRVRKVFEGSEGVNGICFVHEMEGLCGLEGIVTSVGPMKCGVHGETGESISCVTAIKFNGCRDVSTFVWEDDWLELVYRGGDEGIESSSSSLSLSLDLVSLLKGHEGITLWSPLWGSCTLERVSFVADYEGYQIYVSPLVGVEGMISPPIESLTADGCFIGSYRGRGGSCVLWPSRDCQTWDGWVAPRWRAKKGESYYYINSGLEVMGGIEEGGETKSSLSDLRFRAYNYFPTFEAAAAMAGRLGDVLQSE